MAVLLSTEFNLSKEQIIQTGVFDVLIDEDSHFFINIKRLQVTQVPEFVGAYDRINEYFRSIGLLLKNSIPGSKLYREALKRFDFPEVNGINLGFSSGSHGAGFGSQLREKIIRDAYEIIKSGSEQPEIFQLTSLFEENVGPDRLSDMVARLVYDNIVAYSKRIYRELGITHEMYPDYHFKDGILKNPYKRYPLLLLPVDILHELPIARCWDDIDRVCRENDAIRDEINDLIGNEWTRMASSAKKRYMREWVFMNPDRICRIINSYKNVKVDSFNIFSDINYLIGFLLSTISIPESGASSSFEASQEIIEIFTDWVENNRGAIVIKEAEPRAAEKTVQRTMHATAKYYCQQNNWDISPEEDGGRGPVDFKVSRGIDKTVIEIKLTSNRDCVHGLEIQIEEYAKAECTDNKIFLLVNTGSHMERIEDVQKKHTEMTADGRKPAHIIVIDSRPKESASKYIPDYI